ncbi:MAG: hypothetical protein KF790_02355 [Steroidobacteraceae bacterium]|nr:hypothetical protein [Steroidobacteraceae bacterium]MCW5571468.1 hypothetical protein [Steroidobacteraceae bacterium]
MVDDLQVFVGALAIGASGYLMWRRNMRALALIEGTATSRVATAAKGYVELSGTARGAGEPPVRDPIQREACLWFKVVTERRRNNEWQVERRESSTQALALEDDSGSCLIIPGEAQIDEEQDPDAIIRDGSSRRHRIWRIRDGDPLYALGFLERRSPPLAGLAHGSVAAEHAVIELLRVWKRDQAKLHERFDANRDGHIDAAEWECARLAARAAVREQAETAAAQSRAEAAAAPDAHITHTLRQPDDGRPLLVSSRSEEQVARRVRRRSWLGLAMFAGGAVYILFALTRCTA